MKKQITSYQFSFNSQQIFSELNYVCEFRNQLTLEPSLGQQHHRKSLKSIGTAIEYLKILDLIQDKYKITILLKDGKLKDVEIIEK